MGRLRLRPVDVTATAQPVAWPRSVLLAVAVLLLLAPFTHRGVFLAGNDASRFAQIEALVDHGVPYIDASRYAWTIDRIQIGEHLYSNKPPMMALLGAGCYWLIQQVTGWRFATDSLRLTWLLTMLLIGIPTAALVGVFDWWLRQEGVSTTTRWLSVAALAGGTILTSYSTTLNNHTNAAAFLFIAFVCARRGSFGWAGWWAGVTTWIDVLPGLCFIPVLLWAAWSASAWSGLRRILAVLGGCALIMLWGNWVTVGSILLPKLVAGGVDQSSHFGGSVGGVLLPERWYYPLECLFGWHGFFLVSPVLLFGVAGYWLAVRRTHGRERTTLLLLVASLALFIGGHIVLVGSYGGWSYGFRYLIPTIPLLCAALPLKLHGWWRRAFVPVLAVSIVFAAIGAYHPWPPAYEQEVNKDPIASIVTNPIGANAAVWLRTHLPGSTPARSAARRFVSPDPAAQRAYFAYFERSRGIP